MIPCLFECLSHDKEFGEGGGGAGGGDMGRQRGKGRGEGVEWGEGVRKEAGIKGKG